MTETPQAPVGERDGEWRLVPKAPTVEMHRAWQNLPHTGPKFLSDFWQAMLAAAPSPPPETRAVEEWISRDDHIAAMEALRAEYMQRLLGSEPRAAGAGEEEIADIIKKARLNSLGRNRASQEWYADAAKDILARIALHNPAAPREGGE